MWKHACSISWPARCARARCAIERKEALLICRADRLAFPIRDGIPVMLEDEARVLDADDPLLER